MKKFLYIGMIFLLALLIVNNSFTDDYFAKLKGDAWPVSKIVDPLYEEIKAKASEYESPPKNAVVDKVWHAIPGYNGLKVDVEASYKRMAEKGQFRPELLVYKEISPAVHLDDLPPSPIYRGNPDKPMVTFIINVAWGNEYLSPILAILKKNGVRATFFLEGRWVKNHPDLAKMIADAGHEIGNHSYSHPDMKQLSAARIREEITKANEVIKATTGKVVEWLGPPSGSYRQEVVKIAAEENMKTVLWSVDTIDWKNPAPHELINRVMSKIHNGAIILMHPTKSTADSLDRLIKLIKEKKLEIDTLSELVSEKRVIKPPVMENPSEKTPTVKFRLIFPEHNPAENSSKLQNRRKNSDKEIYMSEWGQNCFGEHSHCSFCGDRSLDRNRVQE
mgnify:CR=1 FL=1